MGLRELEFGGGLLIGAAQDDEGLSLAFSFGVIDASDIALSKAESMIGRRVWLAKIKGKTLLEPMSNYFLGAGAREPQPEPQSQPHKAPVLEAIEQIRADLPTKAVETDYNEDLPAILAALQRGPLRTLEISMLCHLSDNAALRRIKILVDTGKVEQEQISRTVSGRTYAFPTKRWRLVQR